MPDRLHIAVVIALIALVAPLDVSADDKVTIESFEGTFESTVTRSTARSQINVQIDEIVADMPFYKRPFARRILKQRTPPCIELQIGYEDGDVSVSCSGRNPAVAELDGPAVQYVPDDGDTVKVQYTLSGNKLIQRFYGDNGVRTNSYELQEDGDTIELDVEIQSSQLPRPLTYERTFSR